MANDPANPYAAPYTESAVESRLKLTIDDQSKTEAVIKDASQVWIAILICLFCTLIGLMLICPWYMIRLYQWYSLARRYPVLLSPKAPQNSLEKRFQSSKIKLFIGVGFGVSGLLIVAALAVLVAILG